MTMIKFKTLWYLFCFQSNYITTNICTGAAGFWVSLDRIATKYSVNQERRSTFVFFVFSIIILLYHCYMHHVMMKSPMVLYYLKLTAESRQRRRIQLHLNPNEDATLVMFFFIISIDKADGLPNGKRSSSLIDICNSKRVAIVSPTLKESSVCTFVKQPQVIVVIFLI